MSVDFKEYSELYHHGIKGQKWGVRRYQNKDGTLTEEGKRRYGTNDVTKAVNDILKIEDSRYDEQANAVGDWAKQLTEISKDFFGMTYAQAVEQAENKKDPAFVNSLVEVKKEIDRVSKNNSDDIDKKADRQIANIAGDIFEDYFSKTKKTSISEDELISIFSKKVGKEKAEEVVDVIWWAFWHDEIEKEFKYKIASDDTSFTRR